jgi:hypothetical protein
MLTPVRRTCPSHPLSADSRRRFFRVRCSAIGPVNRVLCKYLKKNCQVQFDCAISEAVRSWERIGSGGVFQAMVHRKDSEEQDLLRQLQGDLPVEKRPFLALASRAGMNEEAVLDTIGTLVQQGVIRKFGAILRHQRAGITRNAMAPGLCRRTGRKRPGLYSHPSGRLLTATKGARRSRAATTSSP